MKIIELTGTTDASGDLTVSASKAYQGYLEKVLVVYVDGATGADLTLTEEGPISESILSITDVGTSSVALYPRLLAQKSDGTNHTVIGKRTLITGKPKLVVAQGGDTKVFRLLLYLSDIS